MLTSYNYAAMQIVRNFQLGSEDLEQADPPIFDIDRGTICVVDLDHLG